MKYFVTTLCLCFCALGLHAQIAEIPFETKKDLMLIKVQVNNEKKTRTFVLDTGAGSAVLDAGVAREMGIKVDNTQSVSGAGGRETYDFAKNHRISIGENVQLQQVEFALVDLSDLNQRLERKFDGIIGHSLLQGFVTKIDFDRKRISFYEKIEQVNVADYEAIRVQFFSGIPIVISEVAVTLTNGRTYDGAVLFDTGAALTLSVNTPYENKHQLARQSEKTLISESQNLTNKSISEDIAIKSMRFGRYELGEMVISIAHDTKGVSSYGGILGILGGKVISRFNLVLDYRRSMMYFKPNNSFDKEFEFPLSAITLEKKGRNIVVERVQKNSPAYEKGVRKGDQVLSVGGNTSNNIDVYRKILKQEGKSCVLKLKAQNGTTRTVSLKLQRLL